MSGYMNLFDLPNIAVGLNIEGCRPTQYLPEDCKWYNIVQVIDEPLKGIDFDFVMKSVHEHNYQFIEEAVGINVNELLDQLTNFIMLIAPKHKNLLVHVHQYTGSTQLAKVLQEKTGIKVRGGSKTPL
jgi:hypothetical protein